MAAYPFPAVEQPAQSRDLAVDPRPACVLDGLACACLVCDRADAAHPRGDVRRLGVGPAAQERLEKARRFVDVEPHLIHLVAADPDMHSAFALDPGERAGGERAVPLVCHRGVPARLNWSGTAITPSMYRSAVTLPSCTARPGPRESILVLAAVIWSRTWTRARIFFAPRRSEQRVH